MLLRTDGQQYSDTRKCAYGVHGVEKPDCGVNCRTNSHDYGGGNRRCHERIAGV
jgi:hypothetical protein